MNELEDILQLADELSQHLEEFKASSIYDINLFEKPKIEENHISYLLYKILDYKGKEGKITCKRFIKTFFPELKEQISAPQITFEKAYRIDILIKDKKYAIIIENKIFGAEFQRNQLARYIQRLLDERYSKEQIHIVIIPQNYEAKYLDGIRRSVWKLPPDWKKTNQDRECAASDQYSCSCDVSDNACNKECTDMSEFKERTKIINNVEIAEWLEGCLAQIDQKEKLLHSSIIQVSDYIQYFNSSKMETKAQNFLAKKIEELIIGKNQDKLDKIDTYRTGLEEIQKALTRTKEEISRGLIGTWAYNLKKKGWEISKEPDALYLEMQLKGICIKCGCWSGCETDDKSSKYPYCGFYIDNKITDNQKRNHVIALIDSIVEEAEYKFNSNGLTGDGFTCYMETFNGDEVCEKLFTAAKTLYNLGEPTTNIIPDTVPCPTVPPELTNKPGQQE